MTHTSYTQCQNKWNLRRDLWWVKFQCTVDASGHAGQNNTSVSFEALRASIDERNDGARIRNAIIVVQERNLNRGQMRKYITFKKNKKNTLTVIPIFLWLLFSSYQHPIHPAPGDDGVQSADDDVELWKEQERIELLSCFDRLRR